MAYYKVTKKQEGGGGGTEPKIVYAGSGNRTTIQTFSYTFTMGGKFQYYVWNGTTSDSSSIVVKLNGTVITPLTYIGSGFAFTITRLKYNQVIF